MILTTAARVSLAEYQYDPSDFATTVVEYLQGTEVGFDSLPPYDPFNDPYTALGRPTVDTTGDGGFIQIGDPVPVVPVYSPFRAFEIVTIGLGGRLIVKFDHDVVDHPRNPYGLDLVVFGNALATLSQGAWDNGDPNGALVGCTNFTDPGTVSVSQDGQTWYTFTGGPFADDFSPTLGRVYDPENPDPSLGLWNEWWGQPTDPTVPLDPQLSWSDFCNQTVAQISQIYEWSAGGTGFDLADLGVPGLDWIQYVRIDAPSAGWTPEIDAVSDVFASLGDSDRDGDLDLADLAAFQVCFTGADNGPRSPECFWADFDGNLATADMDVDLADYEQFYQYFIGPGLGTEQGQSAKLQ